jgi:hypothetical protein
MYITVVIKPPELFLHIFLSIVVYFLSLLLKALLLFRNDPELDIVAESNLHSLKSSQSLRRYTLVKHYGNLEMERRIKSVSRLNRNTFQLVNRGYINNLT